MGIDKLGKAVQLGACLRVGSVLLQQFDECDAVVVSFVDARLHPRVLHGLSGLSDHLAADGLSPHVVFHLALVEEGHGPHGGVVGLVCHLLQLPLVVVHLLQVVGAVVAEQHHADDSHLQSWVACSLVAVEHALIEFQCFEEVALVEEEIAFDLVGAVGVDALLAAQPVEGEQGAVHVEEGVGVYLLNGPLGGGVGRVGRPAHRG